MLVGTQQESGVAVLHKGSYFWWAGWQYQWQELQAHAGFPLLWWSLLQGPTHSPHPRSKMRRRWWCVRSGIGTCRLPVFHSSTSYALLRRKCRCVGKVGAAGCSAGPLVGLAGMPGWARCAQQNEAALRRCSWATALLQGLSVVLANAMLSAGEEVVGQPGGCWIKRLVGDDMGELEGNWCIAQLWRNSLCW